MFNSDRWRIPLLFAVMASAAAMLVGLSCMAGEPKETIIVQRKLGQTIEIIHVDGTTTKISPDARFLHTSPEGTKLVTLAEVAEEKEKEQEKAASPAGTPAGRPLTPSSRSAHQNPSRFQVSPAGDTAVLLDTVSGKTWLLYYPDKSIPARMNEMRGKTWKEMPCIWLPLHRPETDAEIEEILARERSLRAASEKLQAERQKQAEKEAKERAEAFRKRWDARREQSSGSTRRSSDETPAQPNDE